MTKQFAIPARYQRLRSFKEADDRMAGGCRLPFITGELACLKDDLGDFLLGRTVTATIEGLQHAPRACPLLSRQAGVGRYGSAVKRSEQAQDRFDAIKSFVPQRYQGDHGSIGRGIGWKNEMDMLPA